MAGGCNTIAMFVAALMLLCMSVGVHAGDLPTSDGRHKRSEDSKPTNDMLFKDNPDLESKCLDTKVETFDICNPNGGPQKVEITTFTVNDEDAADYVLKLKGDDAWKLCDHLKNKHGNG